MLILLPIWYIVTGLIMILLPILFNDTHYQIGNNINISLYIWPLWLKLKAFGNFNKGIPILRQPWLFFYVFEQIFIVVKGQMLSK